MKICPKCQRNNGDSLQRCMYCQSDLGGVAEIEIDVEDLSSFVEDMFQAKDLKLLTKDKVLTPSLPKAMVELDEREDELPMLDSSDLILVEEKEDFLSSLRPLWKTLEATKEPAQQVERLLQLARKASQKAYQLEKVELDWPRKLFSLFVDTPNSPVFARHLVKILGIDGSTARTLALSSFPRIAVCNKSAAIIRVLAKRYKEVIGRPAICLVRKDLEAIVNAQLCLRCMPDGFWVGEGPIWKKPQLAQHSSLEMLVVRPGLILVGTVEIQYYRESRRKKEHSWQKSRSERRRVIDLHHPQGIVRLVEQVTNFSALPHFQAQANSLNCKRYVDLLPSLFPGVPIYLGYSALVAPKGIEESKREEFTQSGWPLWEAYTRACRLLFMAKKNP